MTEIPFELGAAAGEAAAEAAGEIAGGVAGEVAGGAAQLADTAGAAAPDAWAGGAGEQVNVEAGFLDGDEGGDAGAGEEDDDVAEPVAPIAAETSGDRWGTADRLLAPNAAADAGGEPGSSGGQNDAAPAEEVPAEAAEPEVPPVADPDIESVAQPMAASDELPAAGGTASEEPAAAGEADDEVAADTEAAAAAEADQAVAAEGALSEPDRGAPASAAEAQPADDGLVSETAPEGDAAEPVVEVAGHEGAAASDLVDGTMDGIIMPRGVGAIPAAEAMADGTRLPGAVLPQEPSGELTGSGIVGDEVPGDAVVDPEVPDVAEAAVGDALAPAAGELSGADAASAGEPAAEPESEGPEVTGGPAESGGDVPGLAGDALTGGPVDGWPSDWVAGADTADQAGGAEAGLVDDALEADGEGAPGDRIAADADLTAEAGIGGQVFDELPGDSVAGVEGVGSTEATESRDAAAADAVPPLADGVTYPGALGGQDPATPEGAPTGTGDGEAGPDAATEAGAADAAEPDLGENAGASAPDAEPDPDGEAAPQGPYRHQGALEESQTALDGLKARMQKMLDDQPGVDASAGEVAGDATPDSSAADAAEAPGDQPGELEDADGAPLTINAEDVVDQAQLDQLGVPTQGADIKALTTSDTDNHTLDIVWGQLAERLGRAGGAVLQRLDGSTLQHLQVFSDDQIRVDLVKLVTDDAKGPAVSRYYLATGKTGLKGDVPVNLHPRHIRHGAHAGLIQARAQGRQQMREAGAVGFRVFTNQLRATVRDARLGRLVVASDAEQRTNAVIHRMQERRDRLISEGKLSAGDGTGPHHHRPGTGNARHRYSQEKLRSARKFGDSQHRPRSRSESTTPGRQQHPNRHPAVKAASAVRQHHEHNKAYRRADAEIKALREKIDNLRRAKGFTPGRGKQIRAAKARLGVARQERFAHSLSGRLLTHTLDAAGL